MQPGLQLLGVQDAGQLPSTSPLPPIPQPLTLPLFFPKKGFVCSKYPGIAVTTYILC